MNDTELTPEQMVARVTALRDQLSDDFRDDIVRSIYEQAENIANRAVKTAETKKYDLRPKN